MASDKDADVFSLKKFLLAAMLWLPLAFFLWYALRSVVAFPVTRIAGALLVGLFPELIQSTSQQYEHLIFTAIAQIPRGLGIEAAQAAVELNVNVLLYCYGLPVLLGLIMATPLNWRQTFFQMGAGLAILAPIQVFGVLGEAFKILALGFDAAIVAGMKDMADAGAVAEIAKHALQHAQGALADKGLGLNVVAYWYQFGYLILPAISPVIAWVLLNRKFVDDLWGSRPARIEARGGPAEERVVER